MTLPVQIISGDTALHATTAQGSTSVLAEQTFLHNTPGHGTLHLQKFVRFPPSLFALKEALKARLFPQLLDLEVELLACLVLLEHCVLISLLFLFKWLNWFHGIMPVTCWDYPVKDGIFAACHFFLFPVFQQVMEKSMIVHIQSRFQSPLHCLRGLFILKYQKPSS